MAAIESLSYQAVYGRVEKDYTWLQVTPYASDELVLIVPRHHELAKKSSIELGELQNLPLVSLNQVCIRSMPLCFRQHSCLMCAQSLALS